jgi:hypothetical protein
MQMIASVVSDVKSDFNPRTEVALILGRVERNRSTFGRWNKVEKLRLEE